LRESPEGSRGVGAGRAIARSDGVGLPGRFKYHQPQFEENAMRDWLKEQTKDPERARNFLCNVCMGMAGVGFAMMLMAFFMSR
jgi:hypothetical protein